MFLLLKLEKQKKFMADKTLEQSFRISLLSVFKRESVTKKEEMLAMSWEKDLCQHLKRMSTLRI